MAEYADQETRRTRPLGLMSTIQPTLVVAIGGTGAAAAKHAKAFMRQIFPEPQPFFFTVRAFDADAQKETLPRLIDNEEFIHLRQVNALAVMHAGRTNPEHAAWRAWMPPRLSTQQMMGGVGGVRPKGRLYYFERRRRIEEAIKDAVRAICNTVAARQLYDQWGVHVDIDRGIEIHLVSSLCGGTGSGMFLDMAYDVRRWAQEISAGAVRVTGHLVLPGAFHEKPVIHNMLQANAYAALQELDYFMHANAERPWRVAYKPSETITDPGPPFDLCYLLDGVRDGGTVSLETLTAMIGEAIVYFAAGEIGAVLKSGITNMSDARLSVADHRGRLCCYSSYGLVTLEVPTALVHHNLGVQVAREVQQRLLVSMPPATGEQVEQCRQEAERFLARELALFPNRLPAPTPDLFEVRRFLERAAWDAARNAFTTEWEQHKRRYLAEAAQLLREPLWTPAALHDSLARSERQLLSLPGGLQGWRAALRHYQELVHTLQGKLHQAMTEADRLATPQAALPDATLAAMRAWNPHDTFDKWHAALAQEALAVGWQAQSQQVQILSGLIGEVITKWDNFAARLGRLAVGNEIRETEYYLTRGARASVCSALSILNQSDPSTSERVMQDIVRQLPSILEHDPDSSGEQLSQAYEALCVKSAREHFISGAALDCEHRLLAEYQSEHLSQRLGLFMSHAAPFWHTAEGYPQAHNTKEITCVGVATDSKIYQPIHSGHRELNAVTEQRADVIPFFRTEHGLSLIGLRALAGYQRAFRDATEGEQRWDFHSFINANWVTEWTFADEYQEAPILQLFSLAEKEGWMIRTGKDFMVPADTEGGSGRRLGSSRLEARQALQAQPQVVEAWHARLQGLINSEELTSQTLEDLIAELRRRVACALQKIATTEYKLDTIAILQKDIFHIHGEIRALRALIASLNDREPLL